MSTTGVVSDVTPVFGGGTLAAAVGATDDVLLLDDAGDFAEDFSEERWLVVGSDLTPRRYVAVQNDEESQESVTLAAGLPSGVSFEADLPVVPWDPAAEAEDKRMVEFKATVRLDGADGSISAQVPHHLIPLAGITALEGAAVRLVESSGEWSVDYVFGRTPVVDPDALEPTRFAEIIGEVAPGGSGPGQTFSTSPPPVDTTGYDEDHVWWQVVDGERLGTWHVVGSVWEPMEVVTQQAVENLSALNLSALNMSGGSIAIAATEGLSATEAFSGTSLPSGWAQPTVQQIEGAAPSALSVASSGPTGQTGSALVLPVSTPGITSGNYYYWTPLPHPSAVNAEVLVKFHPGAAPSTINYPDAQVFLRASGMVDGLDPASAGIGVSLTPASSSSSSSTTYVVREFNGSSDFASVAYPTGAIWGRWSWLRARLVGDLFQTRIWADGSAEPSVWHYSAAAGITSARGVVGISGRQGASSGAPASGDAVRIDQFNVTHLPSGFNVNLDGTGEWPALGITAGDPTWRTVGGTGQPAFQNGWSALSGDSVQFRKSPTGDVAIAGRAAPGTASAAVFTLPDGYRPSRDMTDIIVKSQGAAGSSAVMDIFANGEVQLRNLGTSTWISLTWAFPSN